MYTVFAFLMLFAVQSESFLLRSRQLSSEGVKGLGGAKVSVVCYPSQVETNKPFIINTNYSIDVPRETDLHVDVLNAQTKKWYAGNTTKLLYQQGFVSTSLTLPEGVEEPFLWKVFITPRDEPFPNMLAETGMIIHIGNETITECVEFSNSGVFLPESQDNVDYVLLQNYSTVLIQGSSSTVSVNYNLESVEKATLNFDLMDKDTNLPLVVGPSVNVTKGRNFITEVLDIPQFEKLYTNVYIVVSMVPTGRTWNDRLAEDRTYLVKMTVT